MAQHFLLSKAAKTLSLAQCLRLSDEEAEAVSQGALGRDRRRASLPALRRLERLRVPPPKRLAASVAANAASDSPITSGTLFASHKLPLRGYLAAMRIFCNEVKGKSGWPSSRDLGISYKAASSCSTNSARRWPKK